MNRKIIALSACLLFSCAFQNVENSSAKGQGNSSFDALSPTSSAIPREQDALLRQVWEKLSKNNGRIYLDCNVIAAFMGEAVYFSESTGLISLGKQGVFDFKKNDRIEIQDFVAPGKLQDFYGLSLLAKNGVNAFIKEKDFYRPRNLQCPFVSKWLQLAKEEYSLDQIEDFRLSINLPSVEILCRYKSQDGLESPKEKSYRIGEIGEVHCPVTEMFLASSPTLEKRTAFDQEILEFFKRELGDETIIPFPVNAPIQFSDKLEFNGVRMFSFGDSLWRDYQLALSKKGFALNGENQMTKKVRQKDSTKRVMMRRRKESQGETIFIGIGMEPIECSNFAYLNSFLSSTPFPAFPKSINIKKVTILDKREHLLKAEVAFSTMEAGQEYWETAYVPLLKSAGFAPEEYQAENELYRSYQSSRGSIKIIQGGATNPYETVYQLLLEEYPEI